MRTLKPIFSMISGFSNVSLSPQTIHFYIWRPQDTSNNSRKHRKMNQIICFANKNDERNSMFRKWERRAPKHPDDPFNKFLKILDQFQPKIMKWIFGDMGPLAQICACLPAKFSGRPWRALEGRPRVTSSLHRQLAHTAAIAAHSSATPLHA